ncbi:hypothetical protein HGQ17_07660 [Nesterenkonia sp. MY13]|uniref:LppX_LprAFG lipoprotein n=1 Tax=Nesterenkonia sedimenti TaxID=1463632 RepID=A0A7X8YDT2_9MICC|nr:hypothetical protein [Nesterenkonia sedimenti]NLS09879.1 hypothetical protein [Nesterenkonia sedimenti]
MTFTYPPVKMSALGVLAVGSLTLAACGNGGGGNGGGDTPEPPELNELVDSMESAVADQKSVAYSADVNMDQDPTGGLMTAPGSDRAEITTEIEGEIQGTARLDVDYDVLVDRSLLHEGRIYASGQTLADWEEADPYPGFDTDSFREDVDGLWFDVTEEVAGDPQYFTSISEAFDNVFTEMRSSGMLDTSFDAETGEHDGEDAWVYTYSDDDGAAEIITTADEDEPLLLRYAVNLDDGAQHVEIDFTDWNEAEIPEAPAEDSLRTMTDLDDLYVEHDSGGF